MLPGTTSTLCGLTVRSFSSAARHQLTASRPARAASTAASSSTPTVATSKFMRQSREDALWTPGLLWRDEEQVEVGRAPEDAQGLAESDLRSVDEGGRETSKMKCVLEAVCSNFRLNLIVCCVQHVHGHPRCNGVRRRYTGGLRTAD